MKLHRGVLRKNISTSPDIKPDDLVAETKPTKWEKVSSSLKLNDNPETAAGEVGTAIWATDNIMSGMTFALDRFLHLLLLNYDELQSIDSGKGLAPILLSVEPHIPDGIIYLQSNEREPMLKNVIPVSDEVFNNGGFAKTNPNDAYLLKSVKADEVTAMSYIPEDRLFNFLKENNRFINLIAFASKLFTQGVFENEDFYKYTLPENLGLSRSDIPRFLKSYQMEIVKQQGEPTELAGIFMAMRSMVYSLPDLLAFKMGVGVDENDSKIFREKLMTNFPRCLFQSVYTYLARQNPQELLNELFTETELSEVDYKLDSEYSDDLLVELQQIAKEGEPLLLGELEIQAADAVLEVAKSQITETTLRMD